MLMHLKTKLECEVLVPDIKHTTVKFDIFELLTYQFHFQIKKVKVKVYSLVSGAKCHLPDLAQ